MSRAAAAPLEHAAPRAWWALSLLTLIYACHTIDRSVISVIIEPVKREFGLSDGQIGLLGGLAHAAPFALAVLPMGWLVDRHSRTRLLAAMLSVWSLLTLASGFATNFTMLLLARIGIGAAESGTAPASLSLISDLFPERRRATAIGLFYLSVAFGMGAIFLLGGAIVAAHGWRSVYFIAGAPGLLLALLLLASFKEPVRTGLSAGSSDHGLAALRQIAKLKRLSCAMAAMALASMVGASVWTWAASLMIRAHGMDLRQAGVVVAMAAGIFQALGAAVAGPLADRFAARRPGAGGWLAAASVLLSVPAGLGMAFSQNENTAIACTLALGFTLGSWLGPGYALIIGHAPAALRGGVLAATQLCNVLVGVGLGPLLTGTISDALGGADSLAHAMACTLMINLFAAMLFWIASKRDT